MRRREMALRKVNGAGNKDLFVQLTVELLIVQFIALVAGLFFIEICMSRFLGVYTNSSQLLLWRDFSISVYCDSFVSFCWLRYHYIIFVAELCKTLSKGKFQ